MMNEALLDYEDRRRDLFDGDEAQREALLSVELDRLLGEELDLAGKPDMIATINRYCREALRRPLISACLMSGTRADLEATFSQLNADQQSRAVELREELASELRLEMTAESTAADLEKLHAGFNDAYAAISGMIGETFKLTLIRDAVREKVMGLFFRLGPIQFLCDIPVISEIMVCGFDRIFVEKGNKVFETGLTFASESELFTVAARIAGRDGKQLTEGAPMADARLPDGSRSNIVASPTSLGGLALTIRKFGKGHWSVSDLRARRACSLPMERFLEACVKARKNIIISGGTGSGKTTLLNALSMFVPDDERIVTIEDTSELRLLNRNLVTLEARRANMDGRGEISIPRPCEERPPDAPRPHRRRRVQGWRDARHASGHEHRPFRLHDHGACQFPRDLILRLETMVLQSGEDLPIHAIRQQISAAVDIVVQVRKTRSMDPDAPHTATQRTIVEIAELGEFDPDTGEIPVNPIFEVAETEARPVSPSRATSPASSTSLPNTISSPSRASSTTTRCSMLPDTTMNLAMAALIGAGLFGVQIAGRELISVVWRRLDEEKRETATNVLNFTFGDVVPEDALALMLFAIFALSAVLTVAGITPLMILIVIFLILAVPIFLYAQASGKRSRELELALPLALQQVANEMAAGATLETALKKVAGTAPAPGGCRNRPPTAPRRRQRYRRRFPPNSPNASTPAPSRSPPPSFASAPLRVAASSPHSRAFLARSSRSNASTRRYAPRPKTAAATFT